VADDGRTDSDAEARLSSKGKSGLIGGQPTRRRWEALGSSLVRPTHAAVQKDCMVVRQQAQSDPTRRVAQFGERKSPIVRYIVPTGSGQSGKRRAIALAQPSTKQLDPL
jgi:hypothetical protein